MVWKTALFLMVGLLSAGDMLARGLVIFKPAFDPQIVFVEPCESPSDVGKMSGGLVCDAKVSEWKKCTSDNPYEKIGSMLCDPKAEQWQKCDSNEGGNFGKYACEHESGKWIKCDDSTFKKTASNFVCNGEGGWLSNQQMNNVKQTASSFFKATETDDKWIHYGDGGNWKACDKPGKLELPTLHINIPYTIGSKMEMAVKVKGVTNDPKYPTEIEIDGNKNWPVDSIVNNLGDKKAQSSADSQTSAAVDVTVADAGFVWAYGMVGGTPYVGFTEGTKEIKELEGFVLQVFDAKKLNNKGLGNHEIEFDVGKETFKCVDPALTGALDLLVGGGSTEDAAALAASAEDKGSTTNYDDFDVRNLFIRTGIVYDGRTYFGDSKPKDVLSASFPFTSSIEPNIKDEVQVRIYHQGLAVNYDNTLIINDKTYLLKDFLPIGYKEFAANDDCEMLWSKDLDYVDVPIKSYDIKEGENSLTIKAAKDGKANYDDFFVDRIEVLINEDADDSYDVTQASNNWSKCSGK